MNENPETLAEIQHEMPENLSGETQPMIENKPRTLVYTPSTVAHILNELRKTIVGQEDVIEQILVAVLAEGHALLEGVPGTAKTLTVKTLAQIWAQVFHESNLRPI